MQSKHSFVIEFSYVEIGQEFKHFIKWKNKKLNLFKKLFLNKIKFIFFKWIFYNIYLNKFLK